MVKNPNANAGDEGSIPGLGGSTGEGNGNPLQDSCLENSTDGGTWWATAHGIEKKQTQLRLSTHAGVYVAITQALMSLVNGINAGYTHAAWIHCNWSGV